MTKNLAYFDTREGCGYLTLASGEEIETTRAQPDRHIQIDDERDYPQLRAGGKSTGNTLIWARHWADIPHHFARDCDARLFRTREAYEKARAEILTKQKNDEGE